MTEGYKMSIYTRGDGWGGLRHEDVEYESADETIAKVWNNYKETCIEGISTGETTITVKTELGTIKRQVVVLPKFDLQLKNCKEIRKNGKLMGYSFQAVNQSPGTVTIKKTFLSDWDDYYWGTESIKGGKPIKIAPGETKSVTVLVSEAYKNDKDFSIIYDGWFGYGVGLSLKVGYAGHVFEAWYSGDDGSGDDGTVFIISRW